MNTLVVGDLHIGGSLSMGKPSSEDSLNSRVLDQSRILNWIIKLSIEKNVSTLILTGDIFEDPNPETYLQLIFIDWLKECSVHNIHVHIIYGNHDIKRIGKRYVSGLDVIKNLEIENVYYYNSIDTIHTKNFSYTLLPFRDKRSLNIPLDEANSYYRNLLDMEAACIPSSNKRVAIGHFVISGSIYAGEIDDVSNEIMLSTNVFDNYDYTWMGHVHTPQIMSTLPYVAHVGSVDISDFGQTEQDKIVIFIDSEKKKFEEISIPTRKIKRIKLEIPKDQDATEYLLSQITDDFSGSILKIDVKIDEFASLDKDLINNKLKDVGIYHLSSFVQTKNKSILSEEKKSLISDSIQPKDALKLWSSISSFSEEERTLFLQHGLEILEETK